MVGERYGVEGDRVRLCVHYQPSYYHFHVHVTHVDVEGGGLMAGKAILLDTIIGEACSLCVHCMMCWGGMRAASAAALHPMWKEPARVVWRSQLWSAHHAVTAAACAWRCTCRQSAALWRLLRGEHPHLHAWGI